MTGKISIKPILAVYVMGLCVGAVLAAVLSLALPGRWGVFASYAGTQAGFLAAVLLFSRVLLKTRVSVVVPSAKPSLKALPLTVAVAAGVYMQNLLPATGIAELWAKAGVYATTAIPSPDDPLNAVVGLLVIAALPAVAEEFLFRGVFACSDYKSRFFMIFYSAAVFALGHLTPIQMTHQFLLGIVLSYLVYVTGTVWYSVAIHFLNNAGALFAVMIPGYAEALDFGGRGAWLLPVLCVAGIIILYPSLYALVKLHSGSGYDENDGFWAVMTRRGKKEWYAPFVRDDGFAELTKYKKTETLYVWTIIVLLAALTAINTVLSVKGVG